MTYEWHPSTPIQVIAFLIALAAAFIALWCIISLSLAVTGGWLTLASHYRLDDEFTGSRRRRCSARMRWGTRYSNCITPSANDRGLFLGMLFLFRFAHPPLFIPWSDIRATRRSGLLFKYLDFEFVRAPSVRLQVTERLGLSALQAAGSGAADVLQGGKPAAA
jgi:hypothetical protein